MTVDNIGRYNVVYTDLNGCTATSSDMVISAQESGHIYVYPNPNNGHFHIRFYNRLNEQITIRIFDERGVAIYVKKATTTTAYSDIGVDVPGIIPGETYIVEIRGANERLIGSAKVVMNNQ